MTEAGGSDMVVEEDRVTIRAVVPGGMSTVLPVDDRVADIVFVCGDDFTPVKSHKAILCNWSQFFAKVIDCSLSIKGPFPVAPIVVLKELPGKDLQDIFTFIYTGRLEVERSRIRSLLKTARFLEMKYLPEKLEALRLINEGVGGGLEEELINAENEMAENVASPVSSSPEEKAESEPTPTPSPSPPSPPPGPPPSQNPPSGLASLPGPSAPLGPSQEEPIEESDEETDVSSDDNSTLPDMIDAYMNFTEEMAGASREALAPIEEDTGSREEVIDREISPAEDPVSNTENNEASEQCQGASHAENAISDNDNTMEDFTNRPLEAPLVNQPGPEPVMDNNLDRSRNDDIPEGHDPAIIDLTEED